MAQAQVLYALGLHMHQPPGNLRLLLDTDPLAAEQIIRCYERVPRYALKFRDQARIHVGFSGILLEQLREREVVDSFRSMVDIPAMLDNYRNADNVELIGMGYYHPLFPLIPPEDWEDHLSRGRQMMNDVFGRAPRGFWPSGMAFCMEMVPALVKAGYEYVIVDGTLVQSNETVANPLRPYRATVDDTSIIVIPRDRQLSLVLAEGTDPRSFLKAIRDQVDDAPPTDQPFLITTWSDGENGGWFRQMHEQSGFFGHFFGPFMEEIATGTVDVQPVSLGDFVTKHPPTEEAQVRPDAWSADAVSGFSRWTASPQQKKAVEHIGALSARYRALMSAMERASATIPKPLHEARTLILESETSCFLSWGDQWLGQLYDRTRRVEALLDAIEKAFVHRPLRGHPSNGEDLHKKP
jgi:4-alpha-glucanotransferase